MDYRMRILGLAPVFFAVAVYGCAGGSVIDSARPSGEMMSASVRVTNEHANSAHIFAYGNRQRVRLGTVPSGNTAIFPFEWPSSEVSFIIDLTTTTDAVINDSDQRNIFVADAAGGTVPCILTAKNTIVVGEILELLIPTDLNPRGRSRCAP